MPKGFVRLTAAQQLAEQIRQQIAEGTWAVGSNMPTMRQLASRYRTSITTVQKAMQELNDQEIIKLRPRQGGVVQNRVPSHTKGRHPKQIGIITGLDPTSKVPPWFGNQISHSARLTLARDAYLVTLLHYWHDKPDHAGQVIEQLKSRLNTLAGVILISTEGAREISEFCDRSELPWMSTNQIDVSIPHNYVMADHLAAGRTVGQCFARLGYRRVAVLFDELENVSPLEKVTGLYQGYLKEGICPSGIELVRGADMEISTGYHAMRQHLQTHAPPQAIFATADPLAIGAMQAAQEAGLRVPQDVGVVGSSGVPTSELPSAPPLTEVRQPVEEIGRQLALCLLEMIRGGVQRISGRRITSPLMLRSSLAVPESIRQQLGIRASIEFEAPSDKPVEPELAFDASQSNPASQKAVMSTN